MESKFCNGSEAEVPWISPEGFPGGDGIRSGP